MRLLLVATTTALIAAVAAFGDVTAVAAGPTATAGGCGLSGAFRVYSSRIDYTSGGAGVMPSTTRRLTLSGGRWHFGTSSGRFRVAAITAADWTKWGIEAYGPTRKVVFSGWSGATATGPIEGTGAQVDFFWLMYPARPPVVRTAGVVSLKFGHAVVPRSC